MYVNQSLLCSASRQAQDQPGQPQPQAQQAQAPVINQSAQENKMPEAAKALGCYNGSIRKIYYG